MHPSDERLTTTPSTLETEVWKARKAKINPKVLTLLKIGSVALVIALGLYFRISDLTDWRKHSEQYLYNNNPILTTFDAYYYLRYARDLREGTYGRIDELRAVPEKTQRPFPPPLLSALTAATAAVTGTSVEWAAALLPAYLGVLLFFPLFFLGRYYGNFASGLLAGFIGICSPYYVRRSMLGWYDTDCGNVTFTIAALCFSVLFATREGRERCIWGALALLNFLLFFLWWDTAPEVTFAICAFPFLVSYFFFIGPKKAHILPLAMVGLSLFVALSLWKGMGFWTHFMRAALDLFGYISKREDPDFPNLGITISEQVRVSLQGAVALAAGNWYLSALALSGLVLLVVRSPKKALHLLVPIGLGALTAYAKRFAIFLAPVVGLGIGQFFYVLFELATSRARKVHWIFLAVVGSTILSYGIWSLVAVNVSASYGPAESPRVAEGMALASKETPDNSVIWAWWDHGYPLMYWSRRGTISDGTYHSGELALITAFPISSADYRQSANWMHFYVVRGMEGFHRVYDRCGSVARGLDLIKSVMAGGPHGARDILEKAGFEPMDEWLSFFFPPSESRRPIYLLTDERLMGTSYWWYWLGTWAPEMRTGEHAIFYTFSRVKRLGEDRLTGTPPFSLDLGAGIFESRNGTIPISRMIFHDDKEWKSMNFQQPGAIFQYDSFTGWGALCSTEIFDSVFNKLFFLRMADVRYFRPIRLETSSVQLWEVRGEIFTETAE